jgi:ketosteroid isomerase-like protein
MSDAVPRSVVDAFYEAFVARDAQRLEPLLHDDVVWTVSGPVDVLSYCGTHRGKAAVLDLIVRVVPSLFRVVSFVQETVLVEGTRVAMLNRRSARRTTDGRMISYRVAVFLRFHDGKVIENLSLLDSFDAAEQLLGHSLAPHEPLPAVQGDLVAV